MSVTVNYFNYTTLRDYASHQCVPIVASMFLCGKLICEGAVALFTLNRTVRLTPAGGSGMGGVSGCFATEADSADHFSSMNSAMGCEMRKRSLNRSTRFFN